jgi:hypothetical protein
MSKKPTIKVVKRNERSGTVRGPAASAKKQPDPTRKMVETVSGWVRDFKQKPTVAPDNLLSTLFEDTPRPNEA